MSTTNNTQHEPNGSDRALKAQLYRQLEDAAEKALQKIINKLARERSLDPPMWRSSWWFRLNDVKDTVSEYMKTALLRASKHVYHHAKLNERNDAAEWRRWLLDAVKCMHRDYVDDVTSEVADRMCDFYEEHFGLRFRTYCFAGRAVFVVDDRDAEDFGEGWEVLRDDVVQGMRTADADYLRIAYLYNASRRLLLRLHKTYVPIPHGRRVCEWVLNEEWWIISRQDAEAIANS